MEALGERRYSSYSFTTLALDGGEWSASRPGRALLPGKKPPIPTVQEAGWASKAGPDTEARGKILFPCRGSNLDRPVVQSVARHYTDWATPVPTHTHTYMYIHIFLCGMYLLCMKRCIHDNGITKQITCKKHKRGRNKRQAFQQERYKVPPRHILYPLRGRHRVRSTRKAVVFLRVQVSFDSSRQAAFCHRIGLQHSSGPHGVFSIICAKFGESTHHAIRISDMKFLSATPVSRVQQEPADTNAVRTLERRLRMCNSSY
jgi:hypothetical protein